MYPWLNAKYQFGTVLIPSLPSTDRLADQGTDLVNLMSASGQKNFLVIGYSQGGLIARDVAQRRPDLVPPNVIGSGVITMDTPNTGALLALTGRVALAGELIYGIVVLASDAGCTTPYDNPACFVASLAAADSYPIVNWAFDTAIPATEDLVPGSPYLNNLNSNSEPFTRVGIAGHSNKRWVLIRWGGDHLCNPEASCGGRAFASYTQFAYDFVLAEAYLALACGDIEGYF